MAVEHVGNDVHVLQVAVMVDQCLDEVIGVKDFGSNIPAGRTWFDRYEREWNDTKCVVDLVNEQLKLMQDILRRGTICQVVVTCIQNHTAWSISNQHPVRPKDTFFECGATKPTPHQRPIREIFGRGIP